MYLQKKVKLLFTVFAIIIFSAIFTAECSEFKKYPVVLLPGDGASQLMVKQENNEVPHYYCRKNKTYRIWFNLIDGAEDCFVANIKLVYDMKTRTSSPPKGVNITVPGFGYTSTVEWISPNLTFFPQAKYFVGLVNALVAKGYTRDVSVRGAPYDFRRAPHEAGDYFEKLVALIEETYHMNGNTKVVMVSHSLGCVYTLFFLNHQDQAWKDNFIQSWVAIAPPLGGATKMFKIYASGDNFDHPIFVDPYKIRKAVHTFPSSAILLPVPSLWKDEVIISTPTRNYTAYDYQQFFNDTNFPIGYELWKDTNSSISAMEPPGVPVFNVHGKDVQTEQTYTYDSDFPEVQPTVKYGKGDGVVNLNSLQYLMKWQNEQTQPVLEFEISGGEHTKILQKATLHNYIINTVLQTDD